MILGCPNAPKIYLEIDTKNCSILDPLWAPILGAFWPPVGCNMASRAPKIAPRRPRERPRRALYASRTAPAPPKTPPGPPPAHPRHPQGSPRASKRAQGASKAPPRALQKRFLRPQVASKSSPTLSCCPATSSLQVASAGSARCKHFARGLRDASKSSLESSPKLD